MSRASWSAAALCCRGDLSAEASYERRRTSARRRSKGQPCLQFNVPVSCAGIRPCTRKRSERVQRHRSPKKGELRFPIGSAGLTLFKAFRNEAVNVRAYRLAVAMPPNTPDSPDWLELPLKPPLRVASPPRISSLPVLPPPRLDSPNDQLRLTRTVRDRMPGPSK